MKNLFKSLAAFQQECPTIHKGTEGYGYSYADLPAIFEVINPLLAQHGLGFTQLIEGQQIKTIVFHIESGEVLESLTDIPEDVKLKGMNDFQVLGSAVTYIRRYSLSSALGIVTDKDTDGAGKQEPKQPTQKKAPSKKSITDERLTGAFEAIKTGKFTVDKFVNDYKLTEAQNKLFVEFTKTLK